MFTKVIPAGNTIRYIKGKKDSMGVKRPQTPEMLRGGDGEFALDYLKLLSLGGVGRHCKAKQRRARSAAPGEVKVRTGADWVRHCQEHLVHFISCFHEEQPEVERHLEQVSRATEDLLLAGLPRDALHFTWYKHGQPRGTHSHGALLRTLLSGGVYQPELGSELRLHFDRLVSRALGYADPLDPRAFRVVHAAWGSWKPQNYDIIRKICEHADAWWQPADRRLHKHADFIRLLREELGFRILHAPSVLDREPAPAHIRVPRYPNTVAIYVPGSEGQKGRAVCLKGPACRPNFRPKHWEQQIEARRIRHEQLRDHPQAVYARFEPLIQARIAAQSPLVPMSAERVSLKDFAWLNQDFPIWENLAWARGAAQTSQPGWASLFTAQSMDWGERHYAFVNEEPASCDLSDPKASPLREWIDQEMQALEFAYESESIDEDGLEAEAGAMLISRVPVEAPVVEPNAGNRDVEVHYANPDEPEAVPTSAAAAMPTDATPHVQLSAVLTPEPPLETASGPANVDARSEVPVPPEAADPRQSLPLSPKVDPTSGHSDTPLPESPVELTNARGGNGPNVDALISPNLEEDDAEGEDGRATFTGPQPSFAEPEPAARPPQAPPTPAPAPPNSSFRFEGDEAARAKELKRQEAERREREASARKVSEAAAQLEMQMQIGISIAPQGEQISPESSVQADGQEVAEDLSPPAASSPPNSIN